MLKATKAQMSKFHVLLNQLGITEQKAGLVSEFSGGRVTSTKDLSMMEASNLLKYLSKYDPLNGMRNKIFSLAYEADIIYGSSLLDKKLNAVKLDSFLLECGTVKKKLAKMTKEELVKTVSQFQQILKHKEESKAGRETKNMLSEMGIPTL